MGSHQLQVGSLFEMLPFMLFYDSKLNIEILRCFSDTGASNCPLSKREKNNKKQKTNGGKTAHSSHTEE